MADDYVVSGQELKDVADAIRSASGTSETLSFPDEYISAINNLNANENVRLDTTLTIEGMAADAKAVGDALNGKISANGRNVQSANLALGAVTTDILADQAVTAAKIANGVIPPAYTLPVATSAVLGGVKPVAATADMTQPVGVDANGALYVDAYSKATIDAILGAYITDIDALVGGDA